MQDSTLTSLASECVQAVKAIKSLAALKLQLQCNYYN